MTTQRTLIAYPVKSFDVLHSLSEYVREAFSPQLAL